MPASLVQAKSLNTPTTQTVVVTFTNPVNPGNCLLAVVGADAGGRTFTVSDTVNGSWSGALFGSSGQSFWIFSLPSTGSGTPQVTAQQTLSNAGMSMTIMEWNGILGTVDKSVLTGYVTTTSGSAGPTGTQTQSGDVGLSCIQASTPVSAQTPGGSYVNVTTPTVKQAVASFVLSDTSAQTGSWTWTTNASGAVMIVTLNPGSVNAAVDTLLGQGWV